MVSFLPLLFPLTADAHARGGGGGVVRLLHRSQFTNHFPIEKQRDTLSLGTEDRNMILWQCVLMGVLSFLFGAYVRKEGGQGAIRIYCNNLILMPSKEKFLCQQWMRFFHPGDLRLGQRSLIAVSSSGGEWEGKRGRESNWEVVSAVTKIFVTVFGE